MPQCGIIILIYDAINVHPKWKIINLKLALSISVCIVRKDIGLWLISTQGEENLVFGVY